MALDTRYRPLTYDEVLGQDDAVAVLMQIVRSGRGFHQSYVFCGGHGSGKTTLGRILARALLCDDPQGGNPCDKCPSCISILENGSSESFVEVDAATNSGKDDVKRIIEELQYNTFSGKQRIYLFDESHQLSKQALDALLKPMEDSIPGTENKQLVCIFCTTEPEKMRTTIFSRCAPAFTIRQVPPKEIGKRLAYVCDQEGIEYEQEALTLIAEATETHIRDALKAVEKISMLGPVNKDNVSKALVLNAHNLYVDILENLGEDLGAVLAALDALHLSVSPSSAYKRLSEIAILAYRLNMGVGKAPGYLDGDRLKAAGEKHQEYLLVIADHLASRPNKPSQHMLVCDLSHLHHQRAGTYPTVQTTPSAAFSCPSRPDSKALPPTRSEPVNSPDPSGKVSTDPSDSPPMEEPQKESAPAPKASGGDGGTTGAPREDSSPLDLVLFRTVLHRQVAELKEAKRGSARRSNMGGD